MAWFAIASREANGSTSSGLAQASRPLRKSQLMFKKTSAARLINDNAAELAASSNILAKRRPPCRGNLHVEKTR
jgi:hypothetical protein